MRPSSHHKFLVIRVRMYSLVKTEKNATVMDMIAIARIVGPLLKSPSAGGGSGCIFGR